MLKCSKMIDIRESNSNFNLDDSVARPALALQIYTRLTLLVGKLVDQWSGTELDLYSVRYLPKQNMIECYIGD
jgi:hypothetical protein